MMTGLSTWRKEISAEMKQYCESWDDVEACAIDDKSSLTYAFSVWTVKRVYFPETYDGSFSVASVSRNPDGKPSGPFGG